MHRNGISGSTAVNQWKRISLLKQRSVCPYFLRIWGNCVLEGKRHSFVKKFESILIHHHYCSLLPAPRSVDRSLLGRIQWQQTHPKLCVSTAIVYDFKSNHEADYTRHCRRNWCRQGTND
jgi:hypothetical protein